MKSSVIMGVDPGAAGAVAWIDSDGKKHVENMPDTARGILDLFRQIFEDVPFPDCVDNVCYLEDVGKGLPGQSSSATAVFARHNGHLEMALMALDVKIVKVLPQKWQKTMGIGKSTDCATKQEWKRKLKAKAEEMYPMFKVTLKNADALLILDYGINQEKR